MKHVLCAALATLVLTGAARADAAKTGDIAISPSIMIMEGAERSPQIKEFNEAQFKLVKRPVLVSLIANGKLLRQSESVIDRWSDNVFVWDNLVPGVYDVNFEGAGLETVVKKGLIVTAGQSVHVIADIKGGKGTRVIQYSGVDPVEELKARIKKLEAELETLRKAVK